MLGYFSILFLKYTWFCFWSDAAKHLMFYCLQLCFFCSWWGGGGGLGCGFLGCGFWFLTFGFRFPVSRIRHAAIITILIFQHTNSSYGNTSQRPRLCYIRDWDAYTVVLMDQILFLHGCVRHTELYCFKRQLRFQGVKSWDA